MTSPWSAQLGSRSSNQCPEKRQRRDGRGVEKALWRQRQRLERRTCKPRTKDGQPRHHHQEPEGAGNSGRFSLSLQHRPPSPMPWFQISHLQNCERINSCSFKPPGVGWLVTAPGTSYSPSPVPQACLLSSIFFFFFFFFFFGISQQSSRTLISELKRCLKSQRLHFTRLLLSSAEKRRLSCHTHQVSITYVKVHLVLCTETSSSCLHIQSKWNRDEKQTSPVLVLPLTVVCVNIQAINHCIYSILIFFFFLLLFYFPGLKVTSERCQSEIS